MALSESDAPNTVSDIPGIAQHYLVCDTEDCENNCQFYCNDCHRSMCEQCRDEHQKSPDTKNHEVVPYRQRKIQLPVEKCKDHPTKDIDMFCQDCQVPGCSKCVTQDHKRHTLMYLETIYSKKFMLCHDNINKIHQYFIPSSQDMQKDIKRNGKEIKEIMDNIRRSLMIEAESLKGLVDTVASDNVEQVNKMEESLMKELQSQDKTYQDYISYLNDLVIEFYGYLSSFKIYNNPLILSLSDRLTIQPVPETTKPVPPIFTAGQYCKGDVTKLLGRVTVPDTKPENRAIKPMETVSTQNDKYTCRYSKYLFGVLLLVLFFLFLFLNIENHKGKEMKRYRDKSDVKSTLYLFSPVTKVREYTVTGVDKVEHMSRGKSGTLWASDNYGILVQTDLQGNELQKIQTNNEIGYMYHTVTQDGDLIYTDNTVIKIKTQDNTITEFTKTGDWEPISIHSSRINGDILVGMRNEEEGKVIRYNKKGEEIQTIQRDDKGQEMYEYPRFITESINGDIWTSDYSKRAVVVVDKSGQYKFSYGGPGPWFLPMSICTDLIGHILVLDFMDNIVDILDQDGRPLSIDLLRTGHQDAVGIGCICVDDENNLHVNDLTNTVTVYKYLQ